MAGFFDAIAQARGLGGLFDPRAMNAGPVGAQNLQAPPSGGFFNGITNALQNTQNVGGPIMSGDQNGVPSSNVSSAPFVGTNGAPPTRTGIRNFFGNAAEQQNAPQTADPQNTQPSFNLGNNGNQNFQGGNENDFFQNFIRGLTPEQGQQLIQFVQQQQRL